MSRNGIGTIRSAKQPSTVDAQRGVSAVYIGAAKSFIPLRIFFSDRRYITLTGNAVANMDLATVMAARADAATNRYILMIKLVSDS